MQLGNDYRFYLIIFYQSLVVWYFASQVSRLDVGLNQVRLYINILDLGVESKNKHQLGEPLKAVGHIAWSSRIHFITKSLQTGLAEWRLKMTSYLS